MKGHLIHPNTCISQENDPYNLLEGNSECGDEDEAHRDLDEELHIKAMEAAHHDQPNANADIDMSMPAADDKQVSFIYFSLSL